MANNYKTSDIYIGKTKKDVFLKSISVPNLFYKERYIAFKVKRSYRNYDVVVDIFTNKEYYCLSDKSFGPFFAVESDLYKKIREEGIYISDVSLVSKYLTYASEEVSAGEILSILYRLNKKTITKNEDDEIKDVVLSNVLRISRKVNSLSISEEERIKLNEELYDLSSAYVKEYLLTLEDYNDINIDLDSGDIKERYLSELFKLEKQLDRKYGISYTLEDEFTQVIPILRR